MNKRSTLALFLIFFINAIAYAQSAALRLPVLFSDNMVLQQGIHAPVWGQATPGQTVTISVGGIKASAKIQADGKWMVRLPVMRAGGPFTMKITSGSEAAQYVNVMVGEVWVCSGQSNMEMPLAGWGKILNFEDEIAHANFPAIRLLQVKRNASVSPLDSVTVDAGQWQVCNPETVGSFSATAYFFARNVYQQQHVAIGLIHSSWGGTIAEAWTSGTSLKTIPDFTSAVASIDSLAAAKDTGGTASGPNRATVLYNAMIHPLIPYGIRGAIWYQGESNASRAMQYRTLFPLLIADWRKNWRQGDFPFYFVQLANYMKREEEPGPSQWAGLREAQLKTLSVPKTGMAVIIDIGEEKDIHPKNKQDVGARLGLIARAQVYGEKIVYSGPLYKSFRRVGNAIRLTFSSTGGGLVANGGDRLTGFAIAGADRKFYWADATITGDQVVVSSEDVPDPVAVRYGWANNPDCNLYNKAGLPASPFRTDDWIE